MYKKDKVSIIIPIYNGEKHLAECLDTIQNQTYTNLEIICINDGSRDKSLSILKEYQKKDDRFIVIDQKNAGQSKARNEGMQALQKRNDGIWGVFSIITAILCLIAYLGL